MNIDRSRFLFLVSAIATTTATACVIVDGRGSSGSGGSGGSDSTSTGSTTGQGGDGTGGVGQGGDGGQGGAGGGQGGAGGGSECDDSKGNPEACASSCEGVDACTNLMPDLKPKIAEDVNNCLNALDPQTCTLFADALTCLLNGLKKACPDPSADDDCTALAATCASNDDQAWKDGCHGIYDGLTEDARKAVSSCAAQAGCTSTTDVEQFCVPNLALP